MNSKDQAIEKLLEWARFAAEETRARVGHKDDDPETLTPSWLPELEAAIETVEAEK